MGRLQTMVCTAIIVLMTLLTSACDRANHNSDAPDHSMMEYVDSVDLYRVLSEEQNPTFSNVDDAICYHQDQIDKHFEDSVFLKMSPEDISNVYEVLVKQNAKTDKYAIVSEYLDHYKVYANLPKPKIEYTAIDSTIPNTEIVDTIIDGKHVKVLQESTTKVEQYESSSIFVRGYRAAKRHTLKHVPPNGELCSPKW